MTLTEDYEFVQPENFEEKFRSLKKQWEEKKSNETIEHLDYCERQVEELEEILKDDSIDEETKKLKFAQQYNFIKKWVLDRGIALDFIMSFDQSEALRILLTKPNSFSDCEYWEHLRDIYQMLPRDRDKIPLLKQAFKVDRAKKDCLMNDAEKQVMEKLPNEVQIYRGMSQQEADKEEYGISWTLDKSIAEFFAFEHPDSQFSDSTKTVVEKTVNKEEIIAYFESRNEEEIIWAAE